MWVNERLSDWDIRYMGMEPIRISVLAWLIMHKLVAAAFLVAVEDALGRKGHTTHAAVRAVLVVRIDVVDKIVPRSKGRGTTLQRTAERRGVRPPRVAGLPDLLRRDMGFEGGNRRRRNAEILLQCALRRRRPITARRGKERRRLRAFSFEHAQAAPRGRHWFGAPAFGRA